MFRKTILSLAAAVAMSAGVASAQYGQPQQPGYGQPQPGYGQTPGGYGDPRTTGGYGPGNGGYNPGGYTPGPGSYGGGQMPGGGKLDLATAQPRQSQAFRYMLPQGWQAVEQPGVCMTVAPDMTMAVGVLTPGPTNGQLSAEQYMKNVLTSIGQFQNINVQNAQRMQPQGPFTEAGTFTISYSVMGQQFMGVINSAVAQQNGQTWGFVQVVLGTPQQLAANGRELVQLSQAMIPLNQQNNAPAPTAGPTPTSGAMPNPTNAPASYPTPSPATSPTPAPANDWNWGGR